MILGYHADILYTDGTRAERWLTVDERQDLIGDERIASATYWPLVQEFGLKSAWLVEDVAPGPYITSSRDAAYAAYGLGAKVTPLALIRGT